MLVGYYDAEHRIFQKVSCMSLEQQTQVMKLIEEIEAADKLTIPRLIIINDWEACHIWSRNDYLAFHSTLGESPTKTIVDYMRAEHQLLIGEPTAAKAVESIGSVVALAQEMTIQVKGRSLVSGLPASVEISSIEVRNALLNKSLNEDFVNALKQYLSLTPLRHKISHKEFAPASIILRGSLRSIRGFREYVQEVTGLKVILDS